MPHSAPAHGVARPGVGTSQISAEHASIYQPHPPARDGRNGSAREQGASTTPPPAAFRHFSKLIGPAWRGEAARRTGTGGAQETLHLSLTAGPAVE